MHLRPALPRRDRPSQARDAISYAASQVRPPCQRGKCRDLQRDGRGERHRSQRMSQRVRALLRVRRRAPRHPRHVPPPPSHRGATRQPRSDPPTTANRKPAPQVGRDHRKSPLIAGAYQGNVGRVEGIERCEIKVQKPPRPPRRNCPPLALCDRKPTRQPQRHSPTGTWRLHRLDLTRYRVHGRE